MFTTIWSILVWLWNALVWVIGATWWLLSTVWSIIVWIFNMLPWILGGLLVLIVIGVVFGIISNKVKSSKKSEPVNIAPELLDDTFIDAEGSADTVQDSSETCADIDGAVDTAPKQKTEEKGKELQNRKQKTSSKLDKIDNTMGKINASINPKDFFSLLYEYLKEIDYLIDSLASKAGRGGDGLTISEIENYIKNAPEKDSLTIQFIDRYLDHILENAKNSTSEHCSNLLNSFSDIKLHGFTLLKDIKKTRRVVPYLDVYVKSEKIAIMSNYCLKYYEKKFAQLQIELEKITSSDVASFNSASAQDSSFFDNMDGHEFEHFCAELLKNNEFDKVEVTSGSGDYGVDILAEKDSITYAIQCKRSGSPIGNKAIQEIYSGRSFYKRHVGVVMTNNYFTPAAIETADNTGIVLWDRDKIEKMVQINHD